PAPLPFGCRRSPRPRERSPKPSSMATPPWISSASIPSSPPFPRSSRIWRRSTPRPISSSSKPRPGREGRGPQAGTTPCLGNDVGPRDASSAALPLLFDQEGHGLGLDPAEGRLHAFLAIEGPDLRLHGGRVADAGEEL